MTKKLQFTQKYPKLNPTKASPHLPHYSHTLNSHFSSPTTQVQIPSQEKPPISQNHIPKELDPPPPRHRLRSPKFPDTKDYSSPHKLIEKNSLSRPKGRYTCSFL
ncbi:unnamed protein product [Cuscuta epithymum]|uniref:Uncharacterized protein n=1 Tax=Cuscuta epithymum TaxID=186058 RepID=A0AAV0DJN6_9ASTE|nr:unnamed protein product [Cuscuta epithymum]